ncbi:hypothetical protein D1O30_03490 [Methylocystis hirsuta]|uniref:Uncharacterized protein n=2 Tax=Methylocystis hirsuta TaxID=369798 RepID=A0A3M9XM84_9HYPH|nr:hypothetical protein D1O30_03490 [Methylocystis hirsuta]
MPKLTQTFAFEGTLSIDSNDKIIEVPRYKFSEKMHAYFTAIAAENMALDRIWKDKCTECVHDGEIRLTSRSKKSDKLLQEALEYFILNELSLHLSDFFNNDAMDKSEVVTLQRNEIPAVLLENRVLELFSRPMDQREAFTGHGPHKGPGKVVFAIGTGGAIYDHFELTLPKKTQVVRLPNNSIEIRTRRFNMSIDIEPVRFRTVFPRQFEQLYMKRNFMEVDNYKVDVNIHIKFKLMAFLSGKRWEYYRWLDSFLLAFRESFSSKFFLKNICWEQALTSMIISSDVIGGKPKMKKASSASAPAGEEPAPTGSEVVVKPHYKLDELLTQCDTLVDPTAEERAWLDDKTQGSELL